MIIDHEIEHGYLASDSFVLGVADIYWVASEKLSNTSPMDLINYQRLRTIHFFIFMFMQICAGRQVFMIVFCIIKTKKDGCFVIKTPS